MTSHLWEEQRIGGYQAEHEAAEKLDAARDTLCRLTGAAGGVVEFVDNGTSAVRLLLESWPLRGGARVAVPRSEFSSNRMVLERLVALRSIVLLELPEDGHGRIDLEQAEKQFVSGVDLVVVSHLPSQRGVVQPIDPLIELAHRFGAEVLLDVCQSLGHRPPLIQPADAYAGTARKWLYGPRGVGFVIVAPELWNRLDGPPTLQTHRMSASRLERLPDAAALESSEAAIAARVAFALALDELEEIGLDAVSARLCKLGGMLRDKLAELPQWALREPLDEGTPLVTLEARGPMQPAEACSQLREAGIAAGVVQGGRALDHDRPVLRLSPDPGVSERDIARLHEVLAS
jgi:selenocysteine lyase/cysteine desulfurase